MKIDKQQIAKSLVGLDDDRSVALPAKTLRALGLLANDPAVPPDRPQPIAVGVLRASLVAPAPVDGNSDEDDINEFMDV